MNAARISSVTPLTCADRISTRLKPNVIAPAAGRAARRSASSENAIAPASVSMCPASDSSASEFANTPTATSTTMNATISASVVFSRRPSASHCPPWWG